MFLAGFDDRRHTVTTPSATVSYVDVGDGPPALFVHGIATHAYLWHPLIAQLSDMRRCIAIDLPLHGQSPARPGQEMTISAFADVLAEVCAALELTELDLVAHDAGGAIAQVLSARRPDLLRTLTLTNCETQDNIPPAAMAPTVELARAGQLASAAPAILADPATSRTFFAVGYRNPEFLRPELVSAFLTPVIGKPAAAERFQELIAGLGPDDLLAVEPALRDLPVPTLIVWGTDDAFFDVKWAYWLAGTIPCARKVIEVAGAKLFFPHEQAGELAPHVRHHWTTAGQSVESGSARQRSDLIDGLCDALDEYDAHGADLLSMLRDTNSVIVELARISDPGWTRTLRSEWRILDAIREGSVRTGAPSLCTAQRDQVRAATSGLRRALTEGYPRD